MILIHALLLLLVPVGALAILTGMSHLEESMFPAPTGDDVVPAPTEG